MAVYGGTSDLGATKIKVGYGFWAQSALWWYWKAGTSNFQCLGPGKANPVGHNILAESVERQILHTVSATVQPMQHALNESFSSYSCLATWSIISFTQDPQI